MRNLLVPILAVVLTGCEKSTQENVVAPDNENKPTTMSGSVQSPDTNLDSGDYEPGDGWEMVWSDEFEGNRLNEDNWNRQVEPAGRFNEEWQEYTASADNAYVENGRLVIKAIHKGGEHGMNQYTSARLNSAEKQTWKYGKIAARIKLPHGMGMWPAFWMLGANCSENGGNTPWPFCGEIDILELYGTKNDALVEGNLHHANTEGKHTMSGPKHYELDSGKFAHNFHVFEIEWNAKQIVWRVDGQDYYSEPIDTEERGAFHQDFYLLLNIAVGGTWAGRPDATTEFPQTMSVDWIRVYQEQ